jgi:hypothetical protein
MDIYELDSYRLSDAVKFHTDLNPRLWERDQMRPEVREALLRIADDFREFLGIDDLAVEDITVSGSNAAYSYTPHSDIDLHLIVDFSKLNPDQVYQELFNAKKYQYNDQHDIKVRGYDVELYVQDSNTPVRSLGEYSIVKDDWTRIPVKRRGNLDEKSTKAKYEKLRDLIELALRSNDLDKIKNITDTIKKYRQAGLDQGGEFGPENLAFKMLRTQGLIKRLWDHRGSLEDARLSLDERRKKKKKRSKKRFTYGAFGGWFYPGYHNDSGATGDAGGDGGGGESVQEQAESQSDIINRFVKSCCDFLGMEQSPRIKLRQDPQWSRVNGTFGRYNPDAHSIELATAGRHIVDILRTLAHEMTHARQNEIVDLPDDAGETGSSFEDSANAMAGRIMRHWADQEPEMFAGHHIEEQLDRPTPSAQEIIRKHGIDEKTFIGQLKKGIQVELEHTKDVRAAMEIAMDHLNERPDYYDMLAAVERPMGEGLGKTLGTAALAGAMALGQAPATAQSSARTAYDIGRVIYNAPQIFSRAGAEEELKGIVRDMARGQSPSVGGRQILGRGEQLTRVVGTASGSTVEQAYEQALASAIANAQQRHGNIQMSKDQWRVTEHQVQRSGEGYQAAVVISGPVNVREDASGYIPTKKQAKDPRFKTALTVDIKPGQLGKEANKLGLQTDSQGRPDLLMKNLANALKEFKETGMYESVNPVTFSGHRINEDQDLFEVKMSPSALEAWARSPEAQGIRAGFEAEMIFRDTQRDEDESEQEPDYDYDERPDSIGEVVDFFSNDDYGYGLTARGRRDLRENLDEEYQEWLGEQLDNEWENNAEDQVRDYMETNVWGDESERESRISDKISDLFPDEDVETIMAAGAAAPRFTRNNDQQEYINQNDLYAKYKEAEDAAYEEFEEEMTNEYESQGRYYDEARDYYSDMMRDAGDYDETEFLRDRYGSMREIADSFNLDWPYWTGESSGGGSRSWQDIADSLESTVGMDVKVGSGYHSVSRKDDRWILEPDGSLDPDDYDDSGLEIVSPPMPLPMALEKLKQVIEWGNKEADAYTNSSTGLHMGVSIPYVGGNVDYVKLVLFMGDEYVLKKFGRSSNTYTASAMNKLRQNIAGARNRGQLKEAKMDPMGALELIQKNLIELAARYIQDGVGKSKYTSAHIKDGYIEFRSPGGDYLAMADRDEYGDIKNTMLRFARAMQIAGNPALERKEYAKKLYKLISPGAKDDALKLFAEYAAGTMSPEELKKRWADAVLQKEMPQKYDQEEYEVVNIDLGTGPESVVGIVSGQDYNDAFEKYRNLYSDNPDWRKLDLRKKVPYWDIIDPEGKIVKTIRATDEYSARVRARSDFEYFSDDWRVVERPSVNEPEPKKELSLRAKVAQRILEKPIWWAVSFGGKGILVQGRSQAEAKSEAMVQDDFFARNRSYLENIRPATKNEIADWIAQQKDEKRDSEQIKARISEPQPLPANAGNPTSGNTVEGNLRWYIRNMETGEILHRFYARDYHEAVTELAWWKQQNPGLDLKYGRDEDEPGQAQTQVPAGQTQSGDWAVWSTQRERFATIGNAGARRFNTQADADAWIRDYNIRFPEQDLGLVAREFAQPGQRQMQPGDIVAPGLGEVPPPASGTGEFTGEWRIVDTYGREIHRFGGVGNVQADANRVAMAWLQRNPRHMRDGVEVVPVMSE